MYTKTITSTSNPLHKLIELIWYILYIIEVILTFRFIFELLNANGGAAFTNFVYNISYPFVYPFINVISPTQIDQFTISWNTLLAMTVYSILAWIIIQLILLIKPTTHVKVIEEKINL